jgi:hypothetical protein
MSISDHMAEMIELDQEKRSVALATIMTCLVNERDTEGITDGQYVNALEWLRKAADRA